MDNGVPATLTQADRLSLMMASWTQMTVCSVLSLRDNGDVRLFGFASAILSALWLAVIVLQWDKLSGRVVGLLEHVREAFEATAPKGLTNGVSSKSKLKRRIRGLDTGAIVLLTDLTDAETQAEKARSLLRKAFLSFGLQALLLYGALAVMALASARGWGWGWYPGTMLLLAGSGLRLYPAWNGALGKGWSAYSKAYGYVHPPTPEPVATGLEACPRSLADPGAWAGVWWMCSCAAVLLALVPGTGVASTVIGLMGMVALAVSYNGLSAMFGSHPSPTRKTGQLRVRTAVLGIESALVALPMWGLAALGDAVPRQVMIALAVLVVPTLYSYARELPVPAAVKGLRGTVASR